MKNNFIYIFIVLFLIGCDQSTDLYIDGACESYGVSERKTPLGTFGGVYELPDSEIQKVCGHTGWVNRQHAGCAILQDNGTVNIYYRNGDTCTLNHEKCHVIHGPFHTKQYIKDVANNHPRPSCPK